MFEKVNGRITVTGLVPKAGQVEVVVIVVVT